MEALEGRQLLSLGLSILEFQLVGAAEPCLLLRKKQGANPAVQLCVLPEVLGDIEKEGLNHPHLMGVAVVLAHEQGPLLHSLRDLLTRGDQLEKCVASGFRGSPPLLNVTHGLRETGEQHGGRRTFQRELHSKGCLQRGGDGEGSLRDDFRGKPSTGRGRLRQPGSAREQLMPVVEGLLCPGFFHLQLAHPRCKGPSGL